MAAPSGIKWGSIYGSGTHRARLGIWTGFLEDNVSITCNVEVWFWSEYNMSDSSNTFYYDAGKDITAATTSKGSKSIKCTSTSQWSTSNQKKLASYSGDFTKSTSAVTRKIYTKLSGIDYVGKTIYANTSWTVPALDKHTITFNANGGSGGPGSQTGYYSKSITLSSTKPTRAYYTFKGWATSASGSVAYSPGDSYTITGNKTLYAVWQANTYSVSYDLQGGSGTSTKQTYSYGGSNITLHSAPTKTNYTFLGWSLSSTATTGSYSAGQSWSSKNAGNYTLYAVWQLNYTTPTIKSFSVARCNSDSDTTKNSSGTSALVTFNWTCSESAPSITIEWKASTDSSWPSANKKTVSTSGTSGTVSVGIGANALNIDLTYSIKATIADSQNSTLDIRTLAGSKFWVDYLAKNVGVAIGKAADTADLFDVGLLSKFWKDVMIGEKTGYLDGNQGIYLDAEGFMHLQRSSAQGYHPYIGFFLDDDTSAGGIIRLNYDSKHMQYLSASGHDFGASIYFVNNRLGIYGANTSGTLKEVFTPQNQYNNTTLGYNNYTTGEGDTLLYGNDVVIYSKAASSSNFRPYYRAGDSISFFLKTTGFVTNSKQDVYFQIPLARPYIGAPTVTLTSDNGFVLRQGGSYTHGSGSSTYVKPSSYTANKRGETNSIECIASFSTTTNATNNDVLAITWSGTVTFS